jgi:IS605 OrfB family transposase
MLEVYQVSKWLIQKCIVEDLTVPNSDHNFGRNVNRLINDNWNRLRFISNISKRCQIFGIELVRVNTCYLSFIGNVIHGKDYPDPIAPTIEIGSRGYKKFVKGWFYPRLVTFNDLPNQWKKEVDSSYKSWLELFNRIKKVGLKYYFSWKDSKENLRVFELDCDRSLMQYNCLDLTRLCI